MANAGVVNATGDAAPDAWRRVVALLIQSLETPARGPLPASPEHDALHRAMLRGHHVAGARTRAADLLVAAPVHAVQAQGALDGIDVAAPRQPTRISASWRRYLDVSSEAGAPSLVARRRR